MANLTPESDILAPRPPSLDDNTDEWNEFTLKNAYVHLPGDSSDTRSLLEASAGFPLTVVGQLEPLDEEDAHLYTQDPGRKQINLVLDKVTTFSYGLYNDGSYAIWAAGKAGWFELKPAKKYKPTFEGMTEAVGLLYFIADCYSNPRKKGKGKNAQILPNYTAAELFEKYAAEELGSTSAEDGLEKMYEHKGFLISSMIAGKEGLFWSSLPLYKHFYAKFPELFAEIRERLQAPIPTEKESRKSNHKRQASEDTNSSVNKRGRKARGGPMDVISLDDSSEAGSARRGSKQKADELPELPRIGASKSKTASRRTRQNSVAERTEEESAEESVATPTKDDETDEEIRLRSRKNKSSLRPRASKANKSAGRKGRKGPAAEEDEDDPDPPSSPMAGKRKTTDEDTPARPPKRRNSRPHDDEGIDIPTSPSVSGDAENALTPETPIGEPSELAIRALHIPDPVQEDTWVCALDGCIHKVYAASNPDSQKLIREHYKLHAFDEDERVQMVKKLAAPSLPTSHLLERVKMHAKEEAFPGSRQMSSRYPMTLPVLQKY